MKLLFALLCLSLCPCLAQDKQAILEKIFTERDPAQFNTAIKQAEAAGVSEQVRLEATFLFYIDQKDDKAIAALSKDFLKHKDNFDPKKSEVFAVEEDWLAVVHYTQAIAALQNNDKEGFKKHIMEAFWLSPAQAPAFATHIEKLRLDEAMAKVTIMPEQKLTNMPDGKAKSFKEILGAQNAVLLHFWSPWMQDGTLADFAPTANEVSKHGISVASVLGESSPEIITDANAMIKEQAANAKTLWLFDDNLNPISQILRIQHAPTMVLLSKDGKVLFNGHPADDAFWDALKKVSPDIVRPATSQE